MPSGAGMVKEHCGAAFYNREIGRGEIATL
jgi:hypothetical protein